MIVSSLHGRPTAAELISAVVDFLDSDVRPATSGQVSFHSRVAANALRIVERELNAVDAHEISAAFDQLGFSDEGQLSGAIRRGEFDERWDALTTLLRMLVRHRLAVAHPGYERRTP